MRSQIAHHLGLAAYASTRQLREGRQAPIAPLANAWIVSAGAANWFGENISQLESRIYVRWDGHALVAIPKSNLGWQHPSRTYLLVETANKSGRHWIQRSERIQMVRCRGCENDFHSEIWSQTSVIVLGVCNKRWAKAIWRHHRCASLYKLFRVSAVEKVFNQHTGRNDKRWLGLCCCKLDILAHDVIITLCQQQRVFWSIKWLLNW
jgi:hypothetical protein